MDKYGQIDGSIGARCMDEYKDRKINTQIDG